VVDHTKCDIFSAGVILFVMKCKGLLPFKENKGDKGSIMMQLFETLQDKPSEFWNMHYRFHDISARDLDKSF